MRHRSSVFTINAAFATNKAASVAQFPHVLFNRRYSRVVNPYFPAYVVEVARGFRLLAIYQHSVRREGSRRFPKERESDRNGWLQ
jgi:hypothetical protein